MDPQVTQEIGKMSRDDLQKNFLKHFETKFEPMIDKKEADSLADAMNSHSPPWAAKDAFCEDALLETLTRFDLRMDIAGNRQASPIKDVFNDTPEKAILGQEYLAACFENALWSPEKAEFAGSATIRSGQPQPFSPPTYGYENRREYDEPLRLSDIVAQRIPINTDNYRAGIIETPTDTKLRKVGEASNLPKVKIVLSDDRTDMEKLGYSLSASYEFYRSSDRRMNVIAEIQRTKAAQIEIAMVDEALQLIGTGGPEGNTSRVAPTAVALSSPPTVTEIIELHGRPRSRGYMITTIIGTLKGVSAYLATDVFYQSDNRVPGVPAREQAMARFISLEKVESKEATEVACLTETGDKPVLLAFDRRKCLDYIVEQRGMISENMRNVQDQTIIMTNSHSFGFRIKAEANQCRYRAVIG